MIKTLHLRKLVDHAKLYFRDKDCHKEAESEISRGKLRMIFNGQKALGMSRASVGKQIEKGVAYGAVSTAADVSFCVILIRTQLEGIIQVFDDMKRQKEEVEACENISETPLVRK